MDTDKERAVKEEIRGALGLDALEHQLDNALEDPDGAVVRVGWIEPDPLSEAIEAYQQVVDRLVNGMVQLRMEMDGIVEDPEPELETYARGLSTAWRILRGEV